MQRPLILIIYSGVKNKLLNMKKIFILCPVIFLFSSVTYGQDSTKNLHSLFNDLVTLIPTVNDQDIKNKVIKNPDLYNTLWNHFFNTDKIKDKVGGLLGN